MYEGSNEFQRMGIVHQLLKWRFYLCCIRVISVSAADGEVSEHPISCLVMAGLADSLVLASTQIHLGDVPTWLAGVGTVGTLGAALWQISAERRHRIEQEKREYEERHRAQAKLIAAIIGPEEHGETPALGRIAVELINSSAEPVYRLVIAIVNIQGTSSKTIEEWL